MNLSDLPAVNATLNALSASFLAAGYIYIRRKNQRAHRRCMIAALLTSVLFLTSYVIYHFQAGHTTFSGPKEFKPIYLMILLTHVVLAIVMVPMILVTLVRGLREQFDQHRRIARWTWPVWMYVSVTGVVIYLLLHQVFPPSR